MNDSTQQTRVAAEMEELNKQRQASLPREFLAFVIGTQKYWILPLLVIMALLGALAFLGSSGLAPFIYPLF
jgi:hypothetical protein